MQSRPALSPPGTDRRRARPTGVTVIDMQELRSKLEELGLDSTGLKLALVERLEAALGKAEQGVPPATTATADNPRPAPELDPAPSAEGTAAPASTSGRVPIQFSAPASTASGELADLEKKKQRAERFGQKLSDADAKRLRALRFAEGSGAEPAANGTAKSGPQPASQPSKGPTKPAMTQGSSAEQEKAKERMKRFGLPQTATPDQAKKAKAASGASGKPPSIPAAGLTSEEAAKRAARQERFAAPLATGPSTAAPNLKPAEEADPAPPTAPTGSAMDKLAARAARFGSGAAPAQATV